MSEYTKTKASHRRNTKLFIRFLKYPLSNYFLTLSKKKLKYD